MTHEYNTLAMRLWVQFLRQLKKQGLYGFVYSHVYTKANQSQSNQVINFKTLDKALIRLQFLPNEALVRETHKMCDVVKKIRYDCQTRLLFQFLEKDSTIKTCFINNLQARGKTLDKYMFLLKERHGYDRFFSSAFSWEESPEGFRYWSDIANQFHNLELSI